MRAFFVLIILSVFCVQTHTQEDSLKLVESSGVEIIVDGQLDEIEWSDARVLNLRKGKDHHMVVLLKYDKDYLYVAFKDLTDANNISYNAEVLISTNSDTPDWSNQSYWFHSSYSNCSAVGLYYFWENCTTRPVGWAANTFPFKEGNDHMEFKISFSKLNINPAKGRQIRMAFKVSDPLDQQAYWPEEALIGDPLTWGLITF
ncbi:hypothetical protein [Aestuariivivens sediminis]|uniref:hypothetical protein n=1 Tax=Aestuariivivens sediminis TaxID=2913557 RepID=UPI001F589F06|nr:hypothetical protein [Aestuariivivens sediminis]